MFDFDKAVSRIAGLRFLGSEDLDEDEEDRSPIVYLMVPSEGALRNIISLWRQWQRDGTVPPGFSTWKAALAQLRDVRPWGPRDRIMEADRAILYRDALTDKQTIRTEIELVYTEAGRSVEESARRAVQSVGGEILSSFRISGASYHALLCDLPRGAIISAIEDRTDSLANEETVLQIRPQSIVHLTPTEEASSDSTQGSNPSNGEAIVAVFDATPLSAHPRLSGALSVDDLFNLESQSVGARVHGTAMASAVIHGDLNYPWPQKLTRPVYFVNMLYAPQEPDQPERFPNKLPADLFEQAVSHMRDGASPAAPEVILINVSLGDPNKPFMGRMSGWARVVDYLASKYGLLFIISAGNHLDALEISKEDNEDFEAFDVPQQARIALKASAEKLPFRRILAPSESINAVTVGALHEDRYVYPSPLPAYTYDIWADTGLCTISSGLGPGYRGATKPDIIAPGGRHHVKLWPSSSQHRFVPLVKNAGHFAGVSVAAPPTPTSLGLNVLGRSVGTSVAAGLVTGVAARAHEALEAAYPDFLDLPKAMRAVLLKALVIHGARWTAAKDILKEILGPSDDRFHYRQKDNIRRYIGYGSLDADMILKCTSDRATMWLVGSLPSDQGTKVQIPWPSTMNGQARPHSLHATLAWMSPPKPNSAAYRAVRFKIVEPAQLGEAGIGSAGVAQPDPNQAHKGTVVHRQWAGDRAAAIVSNGLLELDIQRETDDIETPVEYGLVVTLEMPGEESIYSEVLNHLSVRPSVAVQT